MSTPTDLVALADHLDKVAKDLERGMSCWVSATTARAAANAARKLVALAPQPDAAQRVPDDYKAWYEEAMVASNEAGFVGLSAAETIRELAATPKPQEQAARAVDECAASGQSCNYGPHGPKGERQCEYCGSEPPPRATGERDSHSFIVKTNREYAAWCSTFYVPESLNRDGMASQDGLWAWQEQERRAARSTGGQSNV